jgi:hypothetical protein
MPTGWRPADTVTAYPVYKIEDVYHFEKYNTSAGGGFTAWIWTQTLVLLLLVSWLFGNIAGIGSPGIFVYGSFIFLFVYALTDLMDGNRYAISWEIAKAALGTGIIIYSGDWFELGSVFAVLKYLLLIYFAASCVATWYFSVKQVSAKESVTVSA